jgi:transcriptional regulator with XRE-family HTH domain
MDLSDYERIASDHRRRPRLCREELILDVTEVLTQAMAASGVTRAELARRLGSTRGHITQLLAGGRNVTLGTIAEIANALGCTVEVKLAVSRRRTENPRPTY